MATRDNSLAVQWLGLRTSTAGSTGLIPGWRTRIPQAVQHGQKNKNKKRLKMWLLEYLKLSRWPLYFFWIKLDKTVSALKPGEEITMY